MVKWLFERRVYKSEINGDIALTRALGNWTVSVNGCPQTSSVTSGMWLDACTKIQELLDPTDISRILVLGLGAGSCIKVLYENFPKSHMIVVEHDPTMIYIAEELGLYAPFHLPEIVVGDAAAVVARLTNQYDLILIDLFYGDEPSPLLVSQTFALALQERLAKEGLIFVNSFRHAQYLHQIGKTFVSRKKWLYRENNLGLFSAPC